MSRRREGPRPAPARASKAAAAAAKRPGERRAGQRGNAPAGKPGIAASGAAGRAAAGRPGVPQSGAAGRAPAGRPGVLRSGAPGFAPAEAPGRSRAGAPGIARRGEAAEPPVERLEVVVRQDHVVPVPRLIVRLLDLVPGDLIALEPEPGGLGLTPQREAMRQWSEGPAEALRLLEAFDRLWPHKGGGVFGPGGTLFLASELFPVTRGQTLVWEVEDQGHHVRLSLRRKSPARDTPEPAKAPARRIRQNREAGAGAQRPRPAALRKKPSLKPRKAGGGRP